jgi:hypothetical protein
MPHQRFLPQALDLFEHIPTPSSKAEPRSAGATQPAAHELRALSDAQLAKLVSEVVAELHRRLAEKPEGRPELGQAVEEAASSLDRLLERPMKSSRRRHTSRAAHPLPSVQEAKRKAIRAALAAGVAPGQVAKHFGLPLAAVRKILSEAV